LTELTSTTQQTMRRHPTPFPVPRLTAAGLVVAALLLASSPARAGGRIGVDFDLGAPVKPVYLVLSNGVGLSVRGGWRFDLGPVWLQPEAGASFVTFDRTPDKYDRLPSGGPAHSDTYSVPRLLAGARFGVGLGWIVQPALFTHVGIGWREHVSSGPAADVGLAFDVERVPHFTFGAQLAYNVVVAPGLAPSGFPGSHGEGLPPIQWLSAGLHAGFSF
jgi:hypothetical protein